MIIIIIYYNDNVLFSEIPMFLPWRDFPTPLNLENFINKLHTFL